MGARLSSFQNKKMKLQSFLGEQNWQHIFSLSVKAREVERSFLVQLFLSHVEWAWFSNAEVDNDNDMGSWVGTSVYRPQHTQLTKNLVSIMLEICFQCSEIRLSLFLLNQELDLSDIKMT